MFAEQKTYKSELKDTLGGWCDDAVLFLREQKIHANYFLSEEEREVDTVFLVESAYVHWLGMKREFNSLMDRFDQLFKEIKNITDDPILEPFKNMALTTAGMLDYYQYLLSKMHDELLFADLKIISGHQFLKRASDNFFSPHFSLISHIMFEMEFARISDVKYEKVHKLGLISQDINQLKQIIASQKWKGAGAYFGSRRGDQPTFSAAFNLPDLLEHELMKVLIQNFPQAGREMVAEIPKSKPRRSRSLFDINEHAKPLQDPSKASAIHQQLSLIWKLALYKQQRLEKIEFVESAIVSITERDAASSADTPNVFNCEPCNRDDVETLSL